MRDGYVASDDDRVAVLSIADAIRYTEAIMTAVELDAESWRAEADETGAHDTADPSDGGPARSPRLTRFASDLWPWPTRSSRSLGRRPEVDAD